MGDKEMKGKICLLLFFFKILFSPIVSADISYADVLTLSEGLRIATENNRLIRITQREEAVSEADILLARARLLPSINASLAQTFLAHRPEAIFGSQIVPMSEKDYLSYSLNIQQTLYDFRGNASHYDASKLIFETKKFDTKRVRNLVAIEFGLIYFDLLESEKMIMKKRFKGLSLTFEMQRISMMKGS
jgi:outer membrane protein TolC